jgi:hypothetical protein
MYRVTGSGPQSAPFNQSKVIVRLLNIKVPSPVIIYWKDRFPACNALVVLGKNTVLLGAIPLEGLDLIVNPVK